MTPKIILAKVRTAPEIMDTFATKYSDYQLITALNSVLNIVYDTLSTSSNDVLTEETALTLEDGAADLPDDFLSTVNVIAKDGFVLEPQTKSKDVDRFTYRIRGKKLYALGDSVTLEYKPFFIPITQDTVDEDMALPNFFGELLKKYVVIVLQGGLNKQDSTVVQQIATDVYQLTGGREFSKVVADPVWFVG